MIYTGRVKTAFFLVVGLFFTFSMVPNYYLGEIPAIAPCITLMGIFICLIPAASVLCRSALGRFYKAAARVAWGVLAAGFMLLVAMTAAMVLAAYEPSLPEDADVIVPGCAILGDQPRPMLRNRLNAAYAYLKNHPQARCVVTGGQFGAYTQASVMKQTLVNMGIEPGRILTDEQSDNTRQNMRDAAVLLGRGTRVVIATDVYHQLRAKMFARKEELIPYALATPTPPNHIVDAWLREYLAVIKAYFFNR